MKADTLFVLFGVVLCPWLGCLASSGPAPMDIEPVPSLIAWLTVNVDYALAHPDESLATFERCCRANAAGLREEKEPVSEASVLMKAVELGYPYSFLKKMLDLGADVDARAMSGDTPLHVAVRRGALPEVRLLILRGANQYSENGGGETPWSIAHGAGFGEVLRIFEGA